MKSLRRSIFAVLCCFLFTSIVLTYQTISAQTTNIDAQIGVIDGDPLAPAMINYQARLTDPTTHAPKPDGVYTLIFRLYESEQATTATWEETHTISLENGVFSTLLGNQNPINDEFINGTERWLSVQVGSDPETSPRQQIAYVPYAIHAQNSLLLAGRAVSSFADKAHTHSGSEIVDESITSADLANTQRQLIFPASALGYDEGAGIVRKDGDGLLWANSFQYGAQLIIPRPLDWDETSPVEIKFLLQPTTNASGAIKFFVRPRTYSSGDSFEDAFGIPSIPLEVDNDAAVFMDTTVTIDANEFNPDDWWYLMIQRDSGTGTYNADIMLLSVVMTYTAVR